MNKIAHRSLIALLLLVGLLISQIGRAATIDINLNDFFADPTVDVAPDGRSAAIREDPGLAAVILSNDPFFGDPEVIQAANNRSLFFDYDFNEGLTNNDQFFAFVIDSSTGLGLSGFEFLIDSSNSGVVGFDLTTLVGLTLGLQFQLTALPDDAKLSSTVEISNVRLVDEMVSIPTPVTLPLILIGLFAMWRNIRVEKKNVFC